MKFTVISHACLLVESKNEKLLIDPWILGSCYWRSWWHFPPARADLFNPEAVSAIYFTHEHPDHLHFPSLRKFPKKVRILVPRFPVNHMAPAIRERGYERVEEIPHAGYARIGGLELHSYQYGTDDSAVVVTDGKTTLLNLNDAKTSGGSLRQILRKHSPIDFLFRSHSPAQAYPFCYTADDEEELNLLPRSHYVSTFAAAVAIVRPRYAVPFASNVCHLHPESVSQNKFMVSPREVREGCRARVAGTEIVLLAPGDSWDREAGFSMDAGDQGDLSEAGISRLAEEKAGTLTRYAKEEGAIPAVDFETFRAYMAPFVRAVPWFLRRAYPARIAFELPDGGFCVIDLGLRRVHNSARLPDDVHSVVRADAHMLRDAIDKQGLNLVGISKRIRVHLNRGGLTCDAAFWGLLTIYELGYLPLRNVMTARALSTLLGRWREMIGYAGTILRPARSLESIIDSWEPR